MSDNEIDRTRAYYDRFASNYEQHRNGGSRYHDWIDAQEVDLIRRLAQAIEHTERRLPRLLEVGCGTGLLLRKFATFADVVGIDVSPNMLKSAVERGLPVVVGDAQKLPFADEQFDLVVAFKTLPHIPDLRRSFQEMTRVCRFGGYVVAEVYNPRSIRGILKRWLPAQATGLEQAESDVFVRFDSHADVLSHLGPLGLDLVATRGLRTWIPMARMLELPVLGACLCEIEEAQMDTRFAAEFAGFVSYVLRRT